MSYYLSVYLTLNSNQDVNECKILYAEILKLMDNF